MFRRSILVTATAALALLSASPTIAQDHPGALTLDEANRLLADQTLPEQGVRTDVMPLLHKALSKKTGVPDPEFTLHWQAVLSVEPWLGGKARVIDGDTLVIEGYRVRLAAIDAFEIDQTCTTRTGELWRCGAAAKKRLVELIGGGEVVCLHGGLDRFGRMLGLCLTEGARENLNQRLVLDGLAIPYRDDDAYRLDAQVAREASSGAWAGSFDPPWQWRARNRR